MAPPEIIGMGEEIKDWHEVKRNGSKMIFLFPDILLSLFVLNFMPIEYIRPPRLCPISFFYSRNIFEIKMLIRVNIILCTVLSVQVVLVLCIIKSKYSSVCF